MLASTVFAFVVALSSLAAVNGAVVQRDGSFTFLTPQPTSPFQAAGSTTSTTTSSSPTTTSTTASGTSSATSVPSITPTTSKTASTTSSSSSSVTSVTAVSSATTTSCPVCPPIVTSGTPIPSIPSTISVASTPTPSPSAGGANCNGVQQWQASFAYNAGDRVIFNNQLFTATQWTYNNAPPAHADQWSAGGTCSQPIVNKANCSGVAAWQSTVAYTTANMVTFNGHLWSAVQWTESNTPGDTSGTWKDVGACA